MKGLKFNLYTESREELKERFRLRTNYFKQELLIKEIDNWTKETFKKLVKDIKRYYNFYPKEHKEYIDEALYHYLVCLYFKIGFLEELYMNIALKVDKSKS